MAIKFLEKDLEQIIFETPQEKLRERGLLIRYDAILRQVNLGSYGIADLVTFRYSNFNRIDITIYELKEATLNHNALDQACRYAIGVNNIIEEFHYLERRDIYLNIVLIGSKIDTTSDFVYLCQMNSRIDLYTYEYSFDGIDFERCNTWNMENTKYVKTNYFSIGRKIVKKMAETFLSPENFECNF